MRTIIVKIELCGDTPFDLIKDDIEHELSCCWNWFDKVEISEQKEITEDNIKECPLKGLSAFILNSVYGTSAKNMIKQRFDIADFVYCDTDTVGDDFFCKDGERSAVDGCTVIPGSGADKPNHPECGKN